MLKVLGICCTLVLPSVAAFGHLTPLRARSAVASLHSPGPQAGSGEVVVLNHRRSRFAVLTMSDEDEVGISGLTASAGLVANLVMWISLYFVATTGGGLPAGPAGLLGALEGVSYLVVVGLAGASLYKKATTGSGLPAGPSGLLGAAEGLSFLSILAGVAVLASLVTQENCVPNALPLADYSDSVPVCR